MKRFSFPHPAKLSILQALNAELGRGKYKVIELEARADGSAIQQYLAELTGARTVPRVFIGGKTVFLDVRQGLLARV